MKPDAALDSWRHWQGALRTRPNIVMEMTGGKINQSYLLESDDRKLVMRRNAPVNDLPGVDRANELLIWRAASNAGLAPAILHSDEHAGLLVTEYIEGASFEQSAVDDALIDRLVNLLARVHLLDVPVPVLDYGAHIEKFWALIESGSKLKDAALLTRRQAMRECVTEFASRAGSIGLCHHDPTPCNVVGRNNNLYLLDWEYAARGAVAMDYAVLGVAWNIDSDEIANRTALEPDLLELAKTIYLYICQLWEEVRA